MNSVIKAAGVFIVFFLLLYHVSFAQISLPSLISDGMILQRNTSINIWGWASPGEKIKISFNGKTANTITKLNGKWLMKLPPMEAGGPYTMRLQGKNSIVLKGILLGDVWLCSGQSNMVHQIRLHNIRYAEDAANADFPEIRQFWVPTATSLNGPQQKLLNSSWKSANPQDIGDFSAVAYFFARNIYQNAHIPIGIINSSVGGTPIEAWTSEEGLKYFIDLQETISKNKDTAYVNRRNKRPPISSSNYQVKDKGLSGDIKWYDPVYVPKEWRNINIPGYWEDQGINNLDGVVWYRKEINLPSNMNGAIGKLFMGRIIDEDAIYINGKEIGSTSYMYPQRRYEIPKGLLKEGKNLIVVRVQNNGGKGGFVPDKPYFLESAGQQVDLKGYWDYKVGEVFRPSRGLRGPMPIAAQNQPTALYNAMIAPFIDYKINGILWYQGESNIGSDYKNLLSSLIKDWRIKFSNSLLPFYYVQLPNFGDMNYLPVESGWAKVREAALQSLTIPNTGMAVTIDLGEWNDIHPDNKKGVGDRLALIARHFNYGESKLVYSGPIFKETTVKNNKIIISFDHEGTGLKSIDGEELSEFAIAGEDKKFVWAKARIVGDKVEVWSDEVANPLYVRYAWADNPVNPNLYNNEGLPASPFRTDK